VHLLARDADPTALNNAAGASVLGRVDNDVDAAAVLFGLLGHRFGVRNVEWDDLYAFDSTQRVHARKRFPRLGDADEHDAGADLAIAWPTGVQPSVIRTRRNVGSQVISRSCGSSCMCGVSLSGKAITTGAPLLSSFSSSRARPPSLRSPCRCATNTGPTSSSTVPTRHGVRSRK